MSTLGNSKFIVRVAKRDSCKTPILKGLFVRFIHNQDDHFFKNLWIKSGAFV